MASYHIDIPASPRRRSSSSLHDSPRVMNSKVSAKPLPCMLEVLYTKQMSRLIHASLTAALLGSVVSIIGTLLARLRSVTSESLKIIPSYWLILEIGTCFSIMATLTLVAIAYSKRLRKCLPSHRTTHQIITLALHVLILPGITPIHQFAELFQNEERGPNPYILNVCSIIKTFSTCAIILYIWITFRLCAIENQTSASKFQIRSVVNGAEAFVLGISVYVLSRMIGSLVFKVVFAPLPLQTVITLIRTLSVTKTAPVGQLTIVSVTTISELYLIVTAYQSSARASSFIAKSDLTEYRFESIMNRFFKISVHLLVMPLLVHLVLQLGYPTNQITAFRHSRGYLLLDPAAGDAVISFSVAIFALRQAFVNLPTEPDDNIIANEKTLSHVKLQLQRSGSRETIEDSVIYSGTKSGHTAMTCRKDEIYGNLKKVTPCEATCFVLETATILLNMSWLVYTYGTTGFQPVTPSDFGVLKYAVVTHVKVGDLDAHALILEGQDRIIVTFKGSNSALNSLSDNDDSLTPILNAYPGVGSPTRRAFNEGRYQALGIQWRGCKVHRGYAKAYANMRLGIVEEIQRLHSQRKRPIYICGHSSGGALATLCSLELSTMKSISDGIVVYTFGSPKTGNSAFASLYDKTVQHHWRCMVAGDFMTNMPTVSGYVHVGNAALFTRNGQLSLAKVLNLRWWQAAKSLYPMYKLTAYYCALEKWAMRQTGENHLTLGLWSWPLDPTTSKHFFYEPESPLKSDKLLASPRFHDDDRSASLVERPKALTLSMDDVADDIVAFTRTP